MAKTLIVQLTCDRCKAQTGEAINGAETVSFGYDGFSYSIDLCAPHTAEFHSTVQSLVTWSSDRTRLSGVRRPRASSSETAVVTDPGAPRRSPGDRDRLKAIREWARKNGHPDLGDRGRIPQIIVDEYEAAAK
jgi:hypothetical protein